MHLWLILVVLLGLLNITRALAHDPDAEVLEVPEVSVVGERPVAASSQQFIPDKEICCSRKADRLRCCG